MSLNIILITGASSGMGRETARQLDKIYTDKIDEIWLIARRRNRLEELANELSHPCHILEMDLADKDSFEKLEFLMKNQIFEKFRKIPKNSPQVQRNYSGFTQVWRHLNR